MTEPHWWSHCGRYAFTANPEGYEVRYVNGDDSETLCTAAFGFEDAVRFMKRDKETR